MAPARNRCFFPQLLVPDGGLPIPVTAGPNPDETVESVRWLTVLDVQPRIRPRNPPSLSERPFWAKMVHCLRQSFCFSFRAVNERIPCPRRTTLGSIPSISHTRRFVCVRSTSYCALHSLLPDCPRLHRVQKSADGRASIASTGLNHSAHRRGRASPTRHRGPQNP